jgi:hypothetical protein
MLERAASNGQEISREDFYMIMTKKTFWGREIKKQEINWIFYTDFKFSK